MRTPSEDIVDGVHLWINGMSLAAVSRHLKRKGRYVSPSTVYRWGAKYYPMSAKFLESLRILVGGKWHADEIYVMVRGVKKYLFMVMDSDTRCCLSYEVADQKDGHNANSLLERTKKYGRKIPYAFVTDALGSYIDAFKKVFAPLNPHHTHSVHIKNASLNNKKRNNNIQERFNSTFRAREKTARGIKIKSSPMLVGFTVNYNFVRPHTGLKGKTPAEAAGVVINGDDPWRTIIGNAALAQGVA